MRKQMMLAAGLVLIAAPAFAMDNSAHVTNPAQMRQVAATQDYDGGSYDRGSRDFWRDRATPSSEAMRDRGNAERAWDGLPHYY